MTGGTLPGFGGIPIVTSPHLPPVSPVTQCRADARRIVRHGLADVLAWLGEEVGPTPGEPVTVAYLMAGLPGLREEDVRSRFGEGAWGSVMVLPQDQHAVITDWSDSDLRRLNGCTTLGLSVSDRR